MQSLHFLFQKGFFCQPFFEKILFVCVVSLPSKRFFFVNHFLKRHKLCIFCFKKVFFCQPFFEKIQTFGFPNKNGIFEKIQGFPKENLCRGPPFLFTPFPRKGAGKGYQVRKLPLFTPF